MERKKIRLGVSDLIMLCVRDKSLGYLNAKDAYADI